MLTNEDDDEAIYITEEVLNKHTIIIINIKVEASSIHFFGLCVKTIFFFIALLQIFYESLQFFSSIIFNNNIAYALIVIDEKQIMLKEYKVVDSVVIINNNVK